LRSGAIQQYSSDGTLLANLGSFAMSGSPFLPRDIATDVAGSLYVADSTRREISVLAADGGLVRKWSAGAGTTLPSAPTGASTWRR
jgi:DNA-binding beta-propeller fold protein YncE